MYKSLITRRGKTFFSSPKYVDQLWGPPCLLFIGYQEFFCQGVKWLRHEADHSAPSMAKFKNGWSYTSALPSSSWYAQGQLYHSYLISVCLHVQGQFWQILYEWMPYSSYETDTKKVPFTANIFPVRWGFHSGEDSYCGLQSYDTTFLPWR